MEPKVCLDKFILIHAGFDFESNNYKGDIEKLEDIHNLFFSFYKSLKPTIKTLDFAEHRYQALFEASKDAIFIIDSTKVNWID